MGSGVSKPIHDYYIPPQYQNNVILKRLIGKVFNKKLNQDALLILLRNHNIFVLDKVRIVIIRYLTLHSNISKQIFNRLAYVLDYINKSITNYGDSSYSRHYYPEELENQNNPAPPLYSEN